MGILLEHNKAHLCIDVEWNDCEILKFRRELCERT